MLKLGESQKIKENGMVQAVLTQSEKDKEFILKCSSALDLSSIVKESVDLIVTSPPYNVGIEYSSNSDTLTYKQYLQFSEEWIRNCYHWSKILVDYVSMFP